MMTIQSSPLLRQALVADATTSAAFGLMMLIGAGPLSGIFGLPEMLLRIAGLVLLPYASFIGWLGLREQIQKPIACTTAMPGFIGPPSHIRISIPMKRIPGVAE